MFVIRITTFIFFLFQCVEGFKGKVAYRLLKSKTLLPATLVGLVSEIPIGERKVLDTKAGTVIVANVDGNFYAVNAKCPHLGLPMKKVSHIHIIATDKIKIQYSINT